MHSHQNIENYCLSYLLKTTTAMGKITWWWMPAFFFFYKAYKTQITRTTLNVRFRTTTDSMRKNYSPLFMGSANRVNGILMQPTATKYEKSSLRSWIRSSNETRRLKDFSEICIVIRKPDPQPTATSTKTGIFKHTLYIYIYI